MTIVDAPRLSVRGLVKEYPGVRALGGVDLDVASGQVHCLVGQNGAGKSTLIRCVAGLVTPDAGTIAVDGTPLPHGDPPAALAAGVATIYQELDLVADLAVADNLFLGHELRRGPLLDRRRSFTTARALLERLGHADIDVKALAGTLSPAARQIVSIARALSREARVLVMDEPSAVLDGPEIEAMFAVVRRLAAEGVGIVYISHRLEEVAAIGDTITVLRDGETVASGLPPATTRDDLVAAMVGRRLGDVFPERPDRSAPLATTAATATTTAPTPGATATVPGGDPPAADLAEGEEGATVGHGGLGPVVLKVEGVSRRPSGGGAEGVPVHDVSFDVRAGEIVGLAGLVGAGRTEVLRIVAGVDRPDAGTVSVSERRLPPGRPDLAIRAGVGLAPEERKSQGLWPGWDLVRNVTVADLRRFRRRALLDRKAERRAAATQLRELGTVPDDPGRLASELSGGNQQKVVLARWLLHDCTVLLLDEPTRGVDVGAKADAYRAIRTLADSGLAVVMVSSELAELVAMCDRIVVLADGRVTATLDGPTATEADLLAHALPATATAAAGAPGPGGDAGPTATSEPDPDRTEAAAP